MASGAGLVAGDVDAFLMTEVELAKAKRQYSTLEKRLEGERTEFSKDYRRLNEQLLSEREKSAGLQARIFELEAQLHQDRIGRFSKEEEEAARRKVLEDELKRTRSKYEAQVCVLEEELRSTKASWASRLSEERRGWQSKALEKAESLQGQMEQTREYYKSQVEQLHRELADILATHRIAKEELEVSAAELREEKRKKKIIKLELEESKEKYRRCLNLASDLVALRKARGTTTTTTPARHSYTTFSSSAPVPPPATSTTRPWSSSGTTSSLKEEEGALLRKQLNLTQVLLEEELRKNRELREELARISA